MACSSRVKKIGMTHDNVYITIDDSNDGQGQHNLDIHRHTMNRGD
jgi:hypothetical protein